MPFFFFWNRVLKGWDKRWSIRRGVTDSIKIILPGLVLFILFALAAEAVLSWQFPMPEQPFQRFDRSTIVQASDGTELRVTTTREGEKRIPVSYEEVPPIVRQTLIVAEDQRFFDHTGVDFHAVARAVINNVVAGKITSGASTISQQVIRIHRPRPRTFRSKLIEAFRARQLECTRSKKDILELYVNTVPWGNGLRGMEAAARYWYGTSVQHLNAVQAATLVAMLPAPTRRSPDRNPELIRTVRNKLLVRMAKQGLVSRSVEQWNRLDEVRAEPHAFPWKSPHFVDSVLAQRDRPYPGRIRTSLNVSMQMKLERAIQDEDTEHVDGLAAVAVDVDTRKIKASVGSPDWSTDRFDASRARRSTGSTLKPFLYTLGRQEGYISFRGHVSDHAITVNGYQPNNFDNAYMGEIRTDRALSQSRNIPAIQLLRQVGTDRFRQLLEDLGLTVKRDRLNLDAVVGGVSASLVNLARSYARFADLDQSSVAGLNRNSRKRVLDVLRTRTPSLLRSDPNQLAWKTGTSSNRRDAICVGVYDGHVIAVWRGRTDGKSHPTLVGRVLAAPLLARIIRACFG